MSRRRKIIRLILAGAITALVVYMAVGRQTRDAVFSIIPGWHTTIYSPGITWAILAVVVLAASLLVYMIFRGIVRLLTMLWSKF